MATPDPVPPYLPAALRLGRDLRPGDVRDLFVLHDDGCPLLAGAGPCSCSPVVTAGFGLWFRKRRGRPWELVSTQPTERAAWAAIRGSGRKGGDWCVLPAGRKP